MQGRNPYEIGPDTLTEEEKREALRDLREASGEPEPPESRELPGMARMWDLEIAEIRRRERQRHDPEAGRRLKILEKARELKGDPAALEQARQAARDRPAEQELFDAAEAFIRGERAIQEAAYRLDLKDPQTVRPEETPPDYEPPLRLYRHLETWREASSRAAGGANREEREAAAGTRDAALRDARIESFRQLMEERRRWHAAHDPKFGNLSPRDQAVLITKEATRGYPKILAESRRIASEAANQLQGV